MHKGPVTVIATEYGTRLDNQPVSRSATVDDVPDFVNLYEYDYQYEWLETHNGDGTSSTSETSSNNVAGKVPGSGTHEWSWSYEGSCGSGCGSGSGSSGAYYSSYGYGSGGGYAGDEPLDYIGDDFFYSSGSGYGGESGSGNGEGSQGDEGQPPFLEWELRGAFLEEWDELREHLARENALREQMWKDAEELWQELDLINSGRHDMIITATASKPERKESEMSEIRGRIEWIEQRLADIRARQMTSFVDLPQRTGGYVITSLGILVVGVPAGILAEPAYWASGKEWGEYYRLLWQAQRTLGPAVFPEFTTLNEEVKRLRAELDQLTAQLEKLTNAPTGAP